MALKILSRPVPESLFNKFAGLQTATLSKRDSGTDLGNVIFETMLSDIKKSLNTSFHPFLQETGDKWVDWTFRFIETGDKVTSLQLHDPN